MTINPIERVWLYLKKEYFTDFTATTYEDLGNRLVTALSHLQANPKICTSLCKTYCNVK